MKNSTPTHRKTLKRCLKATAQTVIGPGRPSVLVASMGRSGSTLVYRAVCEAVARASVIGNGLALRIVSDTAWDLASARLRPGVVYKTHDLARDPLNGRNVRAIFLFGPASDAALSVLSCGERFGRDWIQEHFRHLHAEGQAEDLLHRDALGFARQLDTWSTPRSYPVMLLHYEAIWDNVGALSDFVGFPVRLPDRRPRGQYHIDSVVEEQVRSTFQSLDTRIAALPRCQVLPAQANS